MALLICNAYTHLVEHNGICTILILVSVGANDHYEKVRIWEREYNNQEESSGKIIIDWIF